MGKLPKANKSPGYADESAACPKDMQHISGVRCGKPVQRCLRYINPPGTKQKSCAEFAAPTRCEGARRKMSYCIDRYEYTPAGYEFPLTHVAWPEAQNLCRAMGRRLCLEEEWEFACEGTEALPYPYGYKRDAEACNHDRPEIELVNSTHHFIDHRRKADGLPRCKSPFGVYNLVGNVDEWTTRTSRKPGWRSILRGGWWLVGRNRCRAATDNHSEQYAGPQTGFRCCMAARASKKAG